MKIGRMEQYYSYWSCDRKLKMVNLLEKMKRTDNDETHIQKIKN